MECLTNGPGGSGEWVPLASGLIWMNSLHSLDGFLSTGLTDLLGQTGLWTQLRVGQHVALTIVAFQRKLFIALRQEVFQTKSNLSFGILVDPNCKCFEAS